MSWFGIGSALIGGAASLFGAKSQNKANKAIAREQMAFQERMSSTAYQRSMDDMRKAGLNPILAYKQGGASSPGGAGIPAVNELGAATTGAQAAARNSLEMKQLGATTEVALTQGELNHQLRLKAIQETSTAKSAAELAAVEKNIMTKFLDDPVGKNLYEIGLTSKNITASGLAAHTAITAARKAGLLPERKH